MEDTSTSVALPRSRASTPAPTTPSTPPMRTRSHPKTPPSPTHGGYASEYDPYPTASPSTEHGSSFASSKSARRQAAPATATSTPRRPRVAREHSSQLASPPSSPAQQRHESAFTSNTPRRMTGIAANGATGSKHLHPSSIAAFNDDPINMMPTPSKTPQKKRVKNTTARVLNFQPEDPNDVMPKSRRIKKQTSRHPRDLTGFELFDEEMDHDQSGSSKIDIFTDTNARVPEADNGDDNPFFGPSRHDASPVRRSKRSRKTAEQLLEDARIDEAVTRGEGMIFTFRGKKVFRPYDDVTHEPDSPGRGGQQRALRRAAGEVAHRPITRSQAQPRLLFADAAQIPPHGHHNGSLVLDSHVDSEADTDIDIDNDVSISSATPSNKPFHLYNLDVEAEGSHETEQTTPVKESLTPVSPPATGRNLDKRRVDFALPAIQEDGTATEQRPEDEYDNNLLSTSAPKKPKPRSPFDAWQRIKSGQSSTGAAKRGADLLEGSSAGSAGKRTRSSERRAHAN